MSTVVFLLQCINASYSGLEIRLKLSPVILLTSSHRQNQILMSERGACQEKLARKSFSGLLIMKFHRSKHSVLTKSFNG